MNIVSIFFAGGLGAISRYSVSILCMSFFSRTWIATLFVNIVGTAVFFLLSKYSFFKENYSELIKIGFLGSLTTFSTFSFELVSLIKGGQHAEAAFVLLLNVLTGIFIGIWILR